MTDSEITANAEEPVSDDVAAEDQVDLADADEVAEDATDSDSDEDNDDDLDDEDDRPITPLEQESEIAADYVEELLDIADMDGDIDTYIQAGRAHVSIVTDGDDTLVGANGEVLEALEELCRLAVMTATGRRSRMLLDVAGYREQRKRDLRALAQDAADEARDSGEPVRLTAMNPFERKVVHDAVAEAGLTSESEGEEPNRRVVVIPA
ncbi:protein jag [Enemella sp. A6]|uniref:Jag family protein n=1 Tax=Enemella sp. A6 TaxID=3440152 RepID=UPI003EBDFB16